MNNGTSQPRWNTELKQGLGSQVKPDANKILFAAWQLTKEKRTGIGFGTLWSFFVLVAAIMLVSVLVAALNIDADGPAGEILLGAIASIMWAPLLAGLLLMALRNATGEKTRGTDAFALLNEPWAFIGISAFIFVVTQLPYLIPGTNEFTAMLLSLPISFIFSFAMMVAVGTKCSVGNALYASVIIIKNRIASFFVFYIAITVLSLVIALPTVLLASAFAAFEGVGTFVAIMLAVGAAYALLFWVTPLFCHGVALYYAEIFGVAEKSVDSYAEGINEQETEHSRADMVNDEVDYQDSDSDPERKNDRDNFQA
ncbi:MAG: hypothetical protein M1473_11285 [Firmicutes bacterium]|nr:hypothetical protein [Gammaproteobacteria bacterium]MCL5051083.1 hypothetical protein [Bacillota bacterium]